MERDKHTRTERGAKCVLWIWGVSLLALLAIILILIGVGYLLGWIENIRTAILLSIIPIVIVIGIDLLLLLACIIKVGWDKRRGKLQKKSEKTGFGKE